MTFTITATFLSRDQFNVPNFAVNKEELDIKDYASFKKIDDAARNKYKIYSPINEKEGTIYLKIKDHNKHKLLERCIYEIKFTLHRYVRDNSPKEKPSKTYLSFNLVSTKLLHNPIDESRIEVDNL